MIGTQSPEDSAEAHQCPRQTGRKGGESKARASSSRCAQALVVSLHPGVGDHAGSCLRRKDPALGHGPAGTLAGREEKEGGGGAPAKGQPTQRTVSPSERWKSHLTALHTPRGISAPSEPWQRRCTLLPKGVTTTGAPWCTPAEEHWLSLLVGPHQAEREPPHPQ